MNFCICYHSKDEAAITILQELKKLDTGIPIYEFSEKEHLIFLDDIDQKVNEDFIIFISKHQAKESSKTLTVHSIGNFGKAIYGGSERKLCPSSSFVNKILYKELVKNASGSKYQCTLEATHHGPYIRKGSCFIELGSTTKEWNDSIGGEIIANTLDFFCRNFKYQDTKLFIPAVGIGAGHYCPSFTKLKKDSPYAISHVLPNYHMPFTEGMILELLNNSLETNSRILIDWKGVGNAEERDHLIKILEKLNLPYIKTSEV